MVNPFTVGTTSFHDYEILKDLSWHCSKCELRSWQAKTWQTWRDEYGIQFEEPSERRWEKRLFCQTCQKTTSHRQLKTLERLDVVSARSWIKPELAKRIKKIYQNEDAILLREFSPNLLEADHKFPQIRWNKNEDDNSILTDIELKNKFIALTRANNLWKSRQCEKCFKTWERWSFPWIYFWHKGEKNWDKNIDPYNEEWCKGCFWHDPYKWREELNNIIKVHKI